MTTSIHDSLFKNAAGTITNTFKKCSNKNLTAHEAIALQKEILTNLVALNSICSNIEIATGNSFAKGRLPVWMLMESEVLSEASTNQSNRLSAYISKINR